MLGYFDLVFFVPELALLLAIKSAAPPRRRVHHSICRHAREEGDDLS